MYNLIILALLNFIKRSLPIYFVQHTHIICRIYKLQNIQFRNLNVTY